LRIANDQMRTSASRRCVTPIDVNHNRHRNEVCRVLSSRRVIGATRYRLESRDCRQSGHRIHDSPTRDTGRLCSRVSPQNYDMWLRPIELRAPNSCIRFWFESNLPDTLLREIHELGHDARVELSRKRPTSEPQSSEPRRTCRFRACCAGRQPSLRHLSSPGRPPPPTTSRARSIRSATSLSSKHLNFATAGSPDIESMTVSHGTPGYMEFINNTINIVYGEHMQALAR
jgi:hypothetical protein